MTKAKKIAPQLPRFVVPKCMANQIQLSKRDKSKTRQKLERMAKLWWEAE